MKNHHFHATLIGTLYTVLGALGLALAVAAWSLDGPSPFEPDRLSPSLLTIVGLMLGTLSLAHLVSGLGVLTGKAWARPSAMAVAVIDLLIFPAGTLLGIYVLIGLRTRAEEEPAQTASPAALYATELARARKELRSWAALAVALGVIAAMAGVAAVLGTSAFDDWSLGVLAGAAALGMFGTLVVFAVRKRALRWRVYVRAERAMLLALATASGGVTALDAARRSGLSVARSERTLRQLAQLGHLDIETHTGAAVYRPAG